MRVVIHRSVHTRPPPPAAVNPDDDDEELLHERDEKMGAEIFKEAPTSVVVVAVI